jgi:hypothetical protein
MSSKFSMARHGLSQPLSQSPFAEVSPVLHETSPFGGIMLPLDPQVDFISTRDLEALVGERPSGRPDLNHDPQATGPSDFPQMQHALQTPPSNSVHHPRGPPGGVPLAPTLPTSATSSRCVHIRPRPAPQLPPKDR